MLRFKRDDVGCSACRWTASTAGIFEETGAETETEAEGKSEEKKAKRDRKEDFLTRAPAELVNKR